MQIPAAVGWATDIGLRKELRKLLDEFLPLSDQLDALCLDHLPALYKRFGQGWNLISKQNLILAEVPATALLQSLEEHLSEVQVGSSRRATILQRIEAARKLVTPEEIALQKRRETLKELCIQRAHRLATGTDTVELDAQIREIKQVLRRHPQLQEGEVLGQRYELLSLLGKGGFARVYQAFDLQTHALVAIKVLHSESSDEPRTLERFYRGAKNMQALNHAHIVRILAEPSRHDGFHYFVMDYLPGGDLQRALCKRQVKFSPDDKLRLLLEVASAIQFAHERGLIHRDVKPENILLDQKNHAYLSDFDLVHAADSTGGTRSHAALGTFLYAAPEQFIDASQVTAAADVFGFGMLTAFVIYGAPLPSWVPSNRGWFLHNLSAPPPIKAALERCLHNDPAQRPTLQALCNDLRLHWIPSKRDEEINNPTIRLSAAELLGPVSTAVPSDSASSSTAMRPAFSAASSGSPLPSAVILPNTSPNKWRWGMLAVTLVILGVGGTLSKSWLTAQRGVEANKAAAQRLLAIDNELERKQWVKALDQANLLLNGAQLPEQTRVLVLARKAQADAGLQQEPLARYEVAVSRGDYDEALKLYRAIPDDNSYKQKHRESYDQVFELFAEQHLKLAETERVSSHCEKFRSELQRILDLEPAHVGAITAKAHPCSDRPISVSSVKQIVKTPRTVQLPPLKQLQVQQPASKSPTADAPPSKQPTLPSGEWIVLHSGTEKLSSADVDHALSNAQKEYVNGNFSLAISLAKAVQRGNPIRAWRIIGASACNIKDVKLASESFKQLDSAGRQYMIYACQRQGITSSGSQFKLSEW